MSNKPKSIEFGNLSSGIKIELVKSKKRLDIYGWYDHYVGIQGGSMTVKDFCEKLGITEKDLK